ncbi:MAG: hypothetical protein C9356_15045 [Oleiphilus sp.]|nr:MAG: hypothetical protein C9356_15045 [Oleiphilus sp.]
MFKLKQWVILCCITLSQLFAVNVYAVKTDTIISGFAKWNASRVEKILLENALLKIKDNSYVIKYFPTTSDVVGMQYDIGGAGLAGLVTIAIENDLKRFEAAIHQCITMNINAWSESSDLLELRNKPKALYQNLRKIITFKHAESEDTMIDFMESVCPGLAPESFGDSSVAITLPDDKVFKELIARQIEVVKVFGNAVFEDLLERLKNSTPETFFANPQVKALINKSEPLAKVLFGDGFKALIAANKAKGATALQLEAFLKSKAVGDFIKSQLKAKAEEMAKIAPQYGALPESLDQFMDPNYLYGVYKKVNQAIKAYKAFRPDPGSDNVPYVVRVHSLLTLIDRYSDIGERDHKGYNWVRKYSMFFASIADASNSVNGAEAVAGVLDDFVDDQGAYRAKRSNDAYGVYRATNRAEDEHELQDGCLEKLCDNMVFVSSYFGVAFSYERTTKPEKGEYSNDYRPFGPVGIELKLMQFDELAYLPEGSLLVNYSPLDIGTYINNELQGDSYEPKLDDIKSPSVFLSYTLNRYPAAFLIGMQEDIPLPGPRGEQMKLMKSWFVSLAFDLPVFTLH